MVEMIIAKDSDPRPESYHVIEDSIKLIESGKILSDQSKVQLWKPFISSSLNALHKDNKNTNKSLGIIKPDPGSIQFKVKLADKSNAEDKKIADLVYKQVSLIEDPLKPLARPKYSFYYHYTCGGHPHKHQIHDWEVQATFINYKRHYKTEDEIIEKMTDMYQEIIPERNLHLIMGTMKAHPQTFIVIGLLRTGLDPEELSKQGVLF
ncbi:MAG: hypothetical protein A2W76_05690 [Gammaproteobacteria bacterium RIFCSPLOWO2_12_47_11]|nr:MAG: hypothetical protein A2W76_05690 [Gammaproteobacteria bacterium RIFCSPLOWO2_12_47_11]